MFLNDKGMLHILTERKMRVSNIKMKLYEIPVNTIVELNFEYLGDRHKVSTGLLYKITNTIYVSAIKDLGFSIPAKKLKSLSLIYKTETGVHTFRELSSRSISFNGQNLYALHSEQNADISDHIGAYRLYIGEPVTAKIILNEKSYSASCILKDISMTGMGIVCSQKIPELARIEISVRINEHRIERISGNIIHIDELKSGIGCLYGCEFDEPNEIIGKYVVRQHEQLLKREKA